MQAKKARVDSCRTIALVSALGLESLELALQSHAPLPQVGQRLRKRRDVRGQETCWQCLNDLAIAFIEVQDRRLVLDGLGRVDAVLWSHDQVGAGTQYTTFTHIEAALNQSNLPFD